MFYKLNVHAGSFHIHMDLCIYLHFISFIALHPSDITAFFEPIFEQAKELRKAYSRFSSQMKVPFITVSDMLLTMW